MAKVRRRLISASKFDKRIPSQSYSLLIAFPFSRPSSHGNCPPVIKMQIIVPCFPVIGKKLPRQKEENLLLLQIPLEERAMKHSAPPSRDCGIKNAPSCLQGNRLPLEKSLCAPLPIRILGCYCFFLYISCIGTGAFQRKSPLFFLFLFFPAVKALKLFIQFSNMMWTFIANVETLKNIIIVDNGV